MTSANYMTGRKNYARPQGMLWADNSGTLVDGIYIPNGYEVNSDTGSEQDTDTFNQYQNHSDD